MPADDSPDSGDDTELGQQLPAPIEQLLEVERLRVERDNRRSDIAEKAIELADTQDRRQYEYATAVLEANAKIQAERTAFLRRLAWGVAGFLAILVFGLLGFAFYGDDAQRTLAEGIVVPGLIGLAGYGVITTVTKVVKALAKP